MEKCYVCKSNRRQLLMLTCSHDVCIKCAADNYFLNNVGKRQNKKDDKKTKKENYFCQICLEVTKTDEATVNQLKQWYITNVNPKSASKANRNIGSVSKELKKQANRIIQEVPIPRSKPSQKKYQNHLTQEQRSLQKRNNRDFRPENTKYSNYYFVENEYDQDANHQYPTSNQRGVKVEQKNKRNGPIRQMPEQYQTKRLLRYCEERDEDDRRVGRNFQEKRQLKRQLNPPSQRYSTKATENNNYRQPPQVPPYERPIQPRYSSRQQADQQSASSKEKRVFGSIIKRDEIKNNENLKEVILKAKDEQRRRINSYKSEQKVQSTYYEPTYRPDHRKLYTETESIEGSSTKYALRQPQINGHISQRRQEAKQNSIRHKESSNKKRQVYLDLIGNQHSLESEEGSYIKQESQDESVPDYRQKGGQQKYNKNYQKPQIINKFSNTAQSTYYNTQNTTTPASSKSPTNILSNQQINPQSSNSLPQARKLYCNIHQDEEIIYYCLQCKLLICSECALYGQHKDHNIHTLKKASFKLKETLYILITEINSYLLIEEQKQQLLMEQIKEIKIQSNKEKEKVKFAFQNFIKNVQNKYSQVLQQLEESQTKALSGFNLQLDKTKQKCTEFFERKNSMKNLFQTFAKNPTNNQLAAPYCQYDSTKNMVASTNAPGTQQANQQRGNRVYRQFDDFFEENSMTSEQRNFFNTNIQELQAKISDYEEYVNKLKPEYQKIVYPSFYNREPQSANKRDSSSKSKQFFRQGAKSRRQSQQLHESLRFSDTSLLIEPTKNTPLKNSQNYDDFLSQQDFIEENNLKSLNLMIEKELTKSQFSELKQKLKVAHVDTIIESIKEIEDIIKEFRIEFRGYEMKVGNMKRS